MTTKNSIPPGTVLTALSKKPYEEVITPHNISVLVLIRCYYTARGTETNTFSMKCRQGFALLIEHLLTCPDLAYDDFWKTLSDPQYSLEDSIISNFENKVRTITRSDVEVLVDYIAESCDSLTDTGTRTPIPIIGRTSPVGTFLRRMIIFLDKLSFAHTVKVYRLYQQYYFHGKDEPDADQYKMDISDDQNEMEISILDPNNAGENPTVLLFNKDDSTNVCGKERLMEFISWSRKQTELFLVDQGALLTYDENSALSPSELHQQMNEIIRINPEYAESYYITYLNCLRVSEYNGAMEQLHKYFDSECAAFQGEDRSRTYRYAALNLAILHSNFDNKKAALNALREAITLSHLARDTYCLYIAYTWYRYLNTDEKGMYPQTCNKCENIEVYPVCSIGLQSYARQCIFNGQNTDAAFQLLQRSEMINSQNLLHDLILLGFANKAAIWDVFGKQTISFLLSQILLFIDATSAVWNLKEYNTESVSIAICNCAIALINEGNYDLAKIPLKYAKGRFPNRYSNWWKFCKQICFFEYAINSEQWSDAHKAASQIATIDKHESLVRFAQLCLAKGDKQGTYNYIKQMLADKENLCITKKLRAYIISAQITQSSSLSNLMKALAIASHYKFNYFVAIIKLEIARLQFQMGFVTEASLLLHQCKVVIFSERRLSDQASYLVLSARCKSGLVAYANSEKRDTVIKDAIDELQMAKAMYKKLNCNSKIKDVLYLQALLANEIGLHELRNKLALNFRKYNEQNPVSECSTYLSSTF